MILTIADMRTLTTGPDGETITVRPVVATAEEREAVLQADDAPDTLSSNVSYLAMRAIHRRTDGPVTLGWVLGLPTRP